MELSSDLYRHSNLKCIAENADPYATSPQILQEFLQILLEEQLQEWLHYFSQRLFREYI